VTEFQKNEEQNKKQFVDLHQFFIYFIFWIYSKNKRNWGKFKNNFTKKNK
jgi:hypothetical protein